MGKSPLKILGYMGEAERSFLPACMPAIYPKIGPSHVRACWAEEEDGCSPKVFWLAEFAEHILGWPVDSPFGVEAKELFDHCGYNVAGGYGIDTNAVLAPFRG